MCPKDGIWECVIDPLPHCTEGILPDGSFGCCEQLEAWFEGEYEKKTKRCQSEQNICFTPENTEPICGYYGECQLIDELNYLCSCQDNWHGEHCENYDPCQPNPCKNQGLCISNGHQFTCNCLNNYDGKICEKSPCEPSRVLNSIFLKEIRSIH